MSEYTAHIDSTGWNGFQDQSIYIWRRRSDGTLEIVTQGGDGVIVVKPVKEESEGVRVDATPFIKFHPALWPEVDGILKAMHDLYRQVHKLEEPTSHERELQAVEEALRIERKRVDNVLDRAIERGLR